MERETSDCSCEMNSNSCSKFERVWQHGTKASTITDPLSHSKEFPACGHGLDGLAGRGVPRSGMALHRRRRRESERSLCDSNTRIQHRHRMMALVECPILVNKI
jgi:hypothetical protein